MSENKCARLKLFLPIRRLWDLQFYRFITCVILK